MRGPRVGLSHTHYVKFYVGCFLKNWEASNHFVSRSSLTTRPGCVQIILGASMGSDRHE